MVVIRTIEDSAAFISLLNINPGILIIKIGATWCGPCTKSNPQIDTWFANMPDNVQCVQVDVDNNTEFCALMRRTKMLKGIPAIYCYVRGNISYIPDDLMVGSDSREIDAFFKRCLANIS
jgi:thioredoxin-like negative regulator of GroEL